MCIDIYYDCEGDEVGMTGVLILRLVCRGEILFSSFRKGGRDKYEVSKMPVGKMPFVWIPMYRNIQMDLNGQTWARQKKS